MAILSSILRDKDLRKKTLFVLGIFAIFRFVAAIPLSVIDTARLQNFFSANPLFGLLNVFTGSTMENFSLVMLGLGPYITAVIIMQLMTMIFPRLKELYQREGEAGRQRFSQYGRILTVPLSFLQGYGILTLLNRQGIIPGLSIQDTILSLLVVTAGTVFLMWLGELISTKGIGNGVSLLIFAGIVSGIPSAIQQIALTYDSTQIPQYLAFLATALLVVWAVAFVSEAQRRIPVSYAKNVRGRRLLGGATTYLPLKVNQAGVIPIIFALSILLFPNLLASFFASSSVAWVSSAALSINRLVANQWFYNIAYFVLVFGFTYFYTQVTFDPKNIAENMQRSSGFIPGIRPGTETGLYIGRVLNRITLAGAIFLGAIAVLPNLVGALSSLHSLRVGGTAALIVVVVVLETIKQVEAQLALRQYDK